MSMIRSGRVGEQARERSGHPVRGSNRLQRWFAPHRTDIAAISVLWMSIPVLSDGNGLNLSWVAALCSLPLAVLAWSTSAAATTLYRAADHEPDHPRIREALGLLFAAVAWSWVAAIGFRLVGGPEDVAAPMRLTAGCLLFVLVGRAIPKVLLHRQRRRTERAVILGAGRVGQLVADKLLRHREYSLTVVGFVDDDPLARSGSVSAVPVLGAMHEIENIIQIHSIDRVIVAFSEAKSAETIAVLRNLEGKSIPIDIVPRLFEAIGPNAHVHTIEGLPVLAVPPQKKARASLAAKRVFDVFVSGVMLVVLSPALLTIAALVKVESDGPVLYYHARIGRCGRRFKLIKFRTMHQAESEEGLDPSVSETNGGTDITDEVTAVPVGWTTRVKQQDDPRVTRLGRFLRRTSLDELPQLFNVLRGDISIVGPRPVADDGELDLYGANAGTLFSLRPGLTGYWQVNGRSEVSYAERIRLDMAYVQSRSFTLDMLIIARTFRAIYSGRGAY